jgi:hypothetical protein
MDMFQKISTHIFLSYKNTYLSLNFAQYVSYLCNIHLLLITVELRHISDSQQRESEGSKLLLWLSEYTYNFKQRSSWVCLVVL